jgi:hypothetical protein
MAQAHFYNAAADYPAAYTGQNRPNNDTVGGFPGNITSLDATELVKYGCHTASPNYAIDALYPGQFRKINRNSVLDVQRADNGQGFINWTLFPVVFGGKSDAAKVSVAPYMVLVTDRPIENQARFIPGRRTRAIKPYETLLVPSRAPKQFTKAFIDTSFISTTKDTELAIRAGLSDVSCPAEVFVTIFPFVTDDVFEGRLRQLAEYGATDKSVWALHGASLGLAIAAAVAGLPPMMYTGFLGQLGMGRTLSEQSETGMASTLLGANLIENVDLVEFKATWACVNRWPIIVPMSSQYRRPLDDVLTQVGNAMLTYQPRKDYDGVPNPAYQGPGNRIQTYGAKIGAYGELSNQTPGELATKYSGMGWFQQMQKAIYTAQEMNMGLDFTTEGSYIIVASSFTEAAALASLASLSISGFDPTGSFQPRAIALTAMANQVAVPAAETIATAKRKKTKPAKKYVSRKGQPKKPKKVKTRRLTAAQKKKKEAADALKNLGAQVQQQQQQMQQVVQQMVQQQNAPPAMSTYAEPEDEEPWADVGSALSPEQQLALELAREPAALGATRTTGIGRGGMPSAGAGRGGGAAPRPGIGDTAGRFGLSAGLRSSSALTKELALAELARQQVEAARAMGDDDTGTYSYLAKQGPKRVPTKKKKVKADVALGEDVQAAGTFGRSGGAFGQRMGNLANSLSSLIGGQSAGMLGQRGAARGQFAQAAGRMPTGNAGFFSDVGGTIGNIFDTLV